MDSIGEDHNNEVQQDASTIHSPSIQEVDDEDIELLCTCLVCQEIMHDPKSLHCKHSYCKDCIEELVEFEDDDVPLIKCPECRVNTILAKGGTVASLKRQPTLEKLMKHLEELNNGRKQKEDTVKELLNCCERPNYWYCWNCKHTYCMECANHDTSISCKNLYPLHLRYSRRFQSYIPYCDIHKALHSNGCLLCADTFCRYCGVLKHMEHQVVSFTEYTNKFKNPIDTKIRIMKTYITKQRDLLDQAKISNFNIENEKEMIDKFLQQKKTVLLSQVLMMLEFVEQPILKHCEQSEISFGKVKNDIEIAVDNDLFHATLIGFDDVRVGGTHNKSITRSVSMLNDKINLSPLLFPNLLNYNEAEKYVHEALEKMNLYTRNKMICLFSFQTREEEEHECKYKHEIMMIVLSTLFVLELCEKKIIKKFHDAWKEFKGLLIDFKDKINQNFTTAKKILKQFETLIEKNPIDIISQAKDLLDGYYSVLHPQIVGEQTKLPEFVVHIEAEEAVENISELLDRDFIAATLNSFCCALHLNTDAVQTCVQESLKNGDGENELMYLFWNRDDCDEAEKYVHKRLKHIGLHNSNKPDLVICKEDVITLVDKGFPLEASINAIYFSNNQGVETAMKWIFEHSKDPDFNVPLLLDYPLKEDYIKPTDAAKLISMGFSELEARIALTKTCNVEDAARWICTHKEKPQSSNDEDESFNDVTSGSSNGNLNKEDGENRTMEQTELKRRSTRKSKKEKWQKKVHESNPEIVMLYYLSNLAIDNRKIVVEDDDGLKTHPIGKDCRSKPTDASVSFLT